MTDGSPLPPGQPPVSGQPQPGQPQQGPYPAGGYPPPGYGPATGGYASAAAPRDPFGSAAASAVGPSTWLALASVAAMALAVSLEEDGDNGWGRIGVWAGFAIVAAVLTVAPTSVVS